MILDRTWNKKEQKLIISYFDKQGQRQFYTKYLHHIKTYEYDDNGPLDTWNNKKCKVVFKDSTQYEPSEFDILEYMYEMEKSDPDMFKAFHAQYFPRLYTFDIETEVSDAFPEPELAEQKVTSISLVGPDLSCIVFGLHKLNDSKKSLLAERYLNWIENNEFARTLKKNKNFNPKCLYKAFDSEEEMLKHWFNVIMPKVGAIAGWNSYRFDWQYLTNRIKKIFGIGEAMNMIRRGSPTFETGIIKWVEKDGSKHKASYPLHCALLDYMEIVEQYDYILRPYESYSLDWVSTKAINAQKIKYDGTLQQLYEKDPEWYYFYNAIDSLLVQLIHYRLKCLESPCAVGAVTLVPLRAAFGQVALTTANVFERFYKANKHVVYNFDEVSRVRTDYEGAFCGCVPGRYEFNVCEDFASLYPSQVQTCNLSFENFYEKKIGPDSLGRYTTMPWSQEELEEFKKDPNYFVSINGNVYKNDQEYAFKRMQRETKQNRDIYKYTGQRIDSELLVEIDRLIKEKKALKGE